MSDVVFLPFSDGESQLSIIAWFKDTRVTKKSVPVGRVGRSIGRESCWSVGSLKLIKIITFGRYSFVLRATTSLECQKLDLLNLTVPISHEVGRKGL